jgi:hypothetical protein
VVLAPNGKKYATGGKAQLPAVGEQVLSGSDYLRRFYIN